MTNIDISQLADEIVRYTSEYVKSIEEDSLAEAKKLGQQGLKRLKQTSPSATGSYKRGWRLTKVKNTYVLHNKTDYQLTHLINKPHLQRDGKMSTPNPHMLPIEQDLINEYVRTVIGIVQS